MKAFEVELKGFYGGHDFTDDLILWVSATSQESIYLAAEELADKIQKISPLDHLHPDEAEFKIPEDTGLMLMTIDERAVVYKDKELIAIEADRLVIWNEQKREYQTLSYGPEAIDHRRLSDREKLMLANYGVDISALKSAGNSL